MQSTATIFEFNGKSSESVLDTQVFKGYIGSVGGYGVGMDTKNITEKVEGIDYGFSYGQENGLFNFDLEIFKEDGTPFTIDERIDINKWLEIDYFADLVFYGDDDGLASNDVVYYCKKTGQSDSIDYGSLYGMTITFESLLPYPTTNTSTQYFDLTDNSGTELIKVKNIGNKDGFFANIYLRIELDSTETGIKLENMSYGGYTTEFTGLNGGDVIIVDPIQTYVYLENDESQNVFGNNYQFPSKFLGYFGLVSGINSIQVTGKCNIEIVARYPLSI